MSKPHFNSIFYGKYMNFVKLWWYLANVSGNIRTNDVINANSIENVLFFFVIFKSLIHVGKYYFYKAFILMQFLIQRILIANRIFQIYQASKMNQ